MINEQGREEKMKKKLLAAILTVTLLISGCSDISNSDTENRTMVKIEQHGILVIYADKDTGVMYITNTGGDSAYTVMLNADGTPKIYDFNSK